MSPCLSLSIRRVLCSALLLGATSPMVHAQESAPTTLPKVKVAAPEEGYRAEATSTATRTDTALRDVPQSITVITRDLIQDQSMQSLADVVRYIPGAGMAQGEGNRDTVILRGNSSTADFFVDGVRDDVEYFRDLYNVDRVEALRGPNAMTFGRGGAGGVINRVTRQAQWERAGEVSLQGGSWNNGRLSFDAGDAVNDKLALRLNGVYENSKSYRDGFELERYGLNPTAAVRLSENTVLRLSYEYFTYDRTADRGVPSLGNRPLRTDESTFFGDPRQSPTDATVNMATAVIDHRFSNNVQLRNRTVYGDYDKFYQNVFPGAVNTATSTVQISAYNNEQLRENFFNQTDLTLTIGSGAVTHRLLAGLELGWQVTDNFRETGFFNNVATSVQAPLSNPRISTPITFRQNATDADNHGTAKIAALYVQDQVELTSRFQLLLGVRYDKFDVDFRNNRTGADFSSSDDLVSPRAGLVYKPAEPMSLYLSYSMTYAPRAGAQLASLNLTNQALDPEEFENIEAGAKWDVAPTLSVTAAIFRLDRKNVAITDPADPLRSILVDGQRTEGVELGVSGNIDEAWSIQGGYAYQDGELTARLGGTRLAQLPEHVVSLWNKYQVTPAWGVGVGVVHQTEMFAAADNAVTLPGFTRVDGAAFFTLNERLRAQLNVENLFGEEYYANAHSNNNIMPGSPRAVRVSLTTRF